MILYFHIRLLNKISGCDILTRNCLDHLKITSMEKCLLIESDLSCINGAYRYIFLIELGMKLCMHIVEISIFSLNNVTVRLTKIMNNLLEHLKILIFKVVFQG
jgi:hypothetical protein